MFIFTKDFCFK